MKSELKIFSDSDRRTLVGILAASGYKVSIEERQGKRYLDRDYFVIVEKGENVDE